MNIEKSLERDRMEIEKIKEELLKLNLDCTTPSIKRIWDGFDLTHWLSLKMRGESIISAHHVQNTVIIEYWERGKEEYANVVEIPDCHISDESVVHYFNGLALFLNLIRPDAILLNNFNYGLCFRDNEETGEDEVYYDEEEYLDNLKARRVSFIATEILMNALTQEDF